MRRNCLRRLTHRSIRLRRLYTSRSYSIGVLRFEWDHGLDAAICQVVPNIVAVIALVAQEPVGIDVVQLHQPIIAFDLVRFAAGKVEGQRVAFSVGAEVDFRREAAARATERFLILIPPFTPAACWCARMMLESTACSLSAGGRRLARVSNAASHTPSLLVSGCR
jgi:hypothetical protein